MKMNNPLRLFYKSLLNPFFTVAATTVFFSTSGLTHAQIFVAGGKTQDLVSEFSLDGTTLNGSLIPGLHYPSGIALSGTDLFVTNAGNGTVGRYSTSGATVNAMLISGLSEPRGIAVSGSNLFVVNRLSGVISEYTLSGQLTNASLITGLNAPYGIAAFESHLFVTGDDGTIGKYNLDGTAVNPALLTGLQYPRGIAVSEKGLFLTDIESNGSGTVGHYTADGNSVNASLITGISFPLGIAVLNSRLFVTSAYGIGEYTTSGEVVNAQLVPNLDGTNAIAVVPEPTGFALLAAASLVLLFFRFDGAVTSTRQRFTDRRALYILCGIGSVFFAAREKADAQAFRSSLTYSFITTLPANDDGSSVSQVPLGFSVKFLGGLPDSDVWVNNNGNITFKNPLDRFTPTPLSQPRLDRFNNPVDTGVILAPFFADVDTRQGSDAETNHVVYYGRTTVNGHNAFTVNWPGVGYYNRRTADSSGNFQLNYFQLVLIDRNDTGAGSGNFDFEFNYNIIRWETGEYPQSGGTDGLGGNPARVGWSNDAGLSYEFPGSAQTRALLDSGPPETALKNNSLGSTVPGRYVFQVRNNVTQPVAYWRGPGSSWNASTNWATNYGGTAAFAGVPVSTTDVIFSASNRPPPSTTLDGNFSIYSLTVNDPQPVAIAGSAYTLTLNGGLITPSGRSGITVNAGTVNITSNLALDPGSGPITVNGTALLNVGNVNASVLAKLGSGTLNVSGTLSPGMVVNVGDGTVNFSQSQTLSGLSIGDGSTVVIGSSGTELPAWTRRR